jgi:hypothetical protein
MVSSQTSPPDWVTDTDSIVALLEQVAEGDTLKLRAMGRKNGIPTGYLNTTRVTKVDGHIIRLGVPHSPKYRVINTATLKTGTAVDDDDRLHGVLLDVTGIKPISVATSRPDDSTAD